MVENICNVLPTRDCFYKISYHNRSHFLIWNVLCMGNLNYLCMYIVQCMYSVCVCVQLPVVAVDSYCPVISPFTGNEQGHLAVLLTMGSAKQVCVCVCVCVTSVSRVYM